jgi:hypothetical protein
LDPADGCGDVETCDAGGSCDAGLGSGSGTMYHLCWTDCTGEYSHFNGQRRSNNRSCFLD